MRRWVGLAFGVCLILSAASAEGTWRITKDHWSARDEDGFARFVAAIGASGCSSSQSCLRDPANPFRASDEKFLDIDTDCAKWPYLMRAYYAWKNGLPFSYEDGFAGSGDDKHNTTGNRPVSRHDFIDRGDGINGPHAVREVIETVSSATYRSDVTQDHGVPSDFYAPAIRPGSIRPGTVIYDTNAHVGIVYKIDGDGRIYYMDAHPDFTITRSVYGAQFGQSPLRLGGGLKNWRPFKLVGAHKDSAGHLLGGHMAFAENDQIADFSLVQYVGTEPNPKQDVKKAQYVYNGVELGFYEYVRVAVSGGKMDFNPIYEMKATMKTLCNDLNDRAQYVDLDIKDGVANRPHPSRLPDNIYGSDNQEWETYSTPSRDARIKAAFAQFYKDLAEMIDLWVHRDERIVYDGYDLQNDLRMAYAAGSKACTITYLNSAMRPVAMTFDDMMRRLFAMSFDPYNCIELRWGASAEERESCPDSKPRLKRYEAEQRLRNQSDRPYDIQMGFDLDELNRHVKGSGIDQPPPIDITALIDSMPDRVPFTGMTAVGR